MIPELLQSMRERDHHQNKAHKTNSAYHWRKYRELKNYVTNQVKLTKSNYYQNLINSNKDNPAALWKTLNEITSRDKSKTTPSCIISDDVSVNDQQSIATIMNEYFTTIGSKLADKIKEKFKPVSPAASTPSPYNFEFEEVDESQVFRELKNLKTNKAIGLDGISARLLKDSPLTITPSLTKMFNISLRSSTFPYIWKKGKVVPLFKSGDPTLPNNYRP